MFEKTTYACLPHKFEAGTPNIAGGIVLGVAVDYLNEVGFDNIAAHEQARSQSLCRSVRSLNPTQWPTSTGRSHSMRKMSSLPIKQEILKNSIHS